MGNCCNSVHIVICSVTTIYHWLSIITFHVVTKKRLPQNYQEILKKWFLDTTWTVIRRCKSNSGILSLRKRTRRGKWPNITQFIFIKCWWMNKMYDILLLIHQLNVISLLVIIGNFNKIVPTIIVHDHNLFPVKRKTFLKQFFLVY